MSVERLPLKGAGRCPRCSCTKVILIKQLPTECTLELCGNCGAAWETYNPNDLLDPWHLSSFREPCDNCAFRSGSPEQQDKDEWLKVIESIKTGDGGFFCHKGVPFDLESEDGFAYPRDKAGKPIVRKLRPCRGYLKMLGPLWLQREAQKQK